jgi:hypothetical protein
MRRLRRPVVQQRRRVFLGCEGESERSYGAWLRMLLEEVRRDVHLNVVLLKPGGGDPLALLERARDKLKQEQRRGESAYVHRAILLDHDRSDLPPVRARRLTELRDEFEFHLIWARPCFEALLLRHLPGCQGLRPVTSAHALTDLRRAWPEYEKGMPALRLARKLAIEQLRQAYAVEPELAEFLRCVGFELNQISTRNRP